MLKECLAQQSSNFVCLAAVMKKTCSIFHFLSQIFQLESCFRMVAVHINRSKTVKLLLCTTTVVLHRELTLQIKINQQQVLCKIAYQE